MAEIVGSDKYMNSDYVEYQRKYRKNIRESDKVTIELIKKNVLTREKAEDLSLLDIGCHNGNLLYHLKAALPQIKMMGGDLFQGVIDECRADPDLAGIDFDVMDVTDLRCEPVDIIVVSAVLARFSREEHKNIWQSFYDILKPNGIVISFDWYNPFRQSLRIIEETETHPNGLILNFWSQELVKDQLIEIGFVKYQFQMFEIPIDLELKDPSDPLYTHTRLTVDGNRLQFRGALYQPWCHLVAHKP